MSDYLTAEMLGFARRMGVRWFEPSSDLSVNTFGWWEDSFGNVIGQDEQLIEWVKARKILEVN